MAEVTLARITKATLGKGDHGFSSWLTLEYADQGKKVGGTGQGMGGFSLGSTFTDYWIKGILNAVGVNDWTEVEGTWIWVTHTSTSVMSITGITTGITFDPRQWKAPEQEKDHD